MHVVDFGNRRARRMLARDRKLVVSKSHAKYCDYLSVTPNPVYPRQG